MQDDETGDVRGDRLSGDELAANFADLHPPLARHDALVEADRCYFCYDAPCVAACPTAIDVPLFIRQIATGRPEGAAGTIFDANIMGGMCARVCPTETLCEAACVRMAGEDGPVRIGLLQRFATDHLMASGRRPHDRAAPTGKRIAVVGAGPAGLSCAYELAKRGHEVVVFEARDKPGGLNEFGIAAYKTVEEFAQREVAFILGIGGIELRSGVALGRGVTLPSLRADYDAVFLGIGLAGVNTLGLDAPDGVRDAVAFIGELRQAADLSTVAVGRKVVVIGGGMTAIDAAIQSRRLGAEEVTIAYRRGPAEMKASRYEQELAQTSGVTIRHWLAPARFHARGRRLEAVEFVRTREPGAEPVRLAADMALVAIGQALLEAPVFDAEPVALERGRILVDAERRTSLAGVWAGGDCIADGEDLTVVAVEDGKRAAASIDRMLSRAGER